MDITAKDAFEWVRANEGSIVTSEALSEVVDGYMPSLPAAGHRSLAASLTCCTTAGMALQGQTVGNPAVGIGRDLAREKELLLCLTRVHYDPHDNGMHRSIIQSVWRKLTGSEQDCEDVGEHWTVIGFQGTNPATDLNRFGGILNVIHMLYLCCTFPTLSIAMYEASLKAASDFPFACASIKYTKLAMDVFRLGRLSRRCNEEGMVMEVVAHFYAACFWLHCRLWVAQGRTIVDFDRTFKEVQKRATAGPERLMRDFDGHREDEALGEEQDVTRHTWDGVEEDIAFADIGAQSPSKDRFGRLGAMVKSWQISKRLRRYAKGLQ